MTEDARFRPAADVLDALAASSAVDVARLRRDLDAAVDPYVHDSYERDEAGDNPTDVDDRTSAPSRR